MTLISISLIVEISLIVKKSPQIFMRAFLLICLTYLAISPQAGTTVCINGFNIFNEDART